MQKYIQKKYQFSNYEMRQLEFFFKTMLSEVSKIIILLVLFHDDIKGYLLTLLLLSLLRTSAGGIHFRTFWGCLFGTIVFFFLSIWIMPNIHLIKPLSLGLLFICAFINYLLAPITAPGHLELPISTIKRAKIKCFIVILLYAIIIFVIPDNRYLHIGFWIIILHTLQLIIAKIQKIGGESNETSFL